MKEYRGICIGGPKDGISLISSFPVHKVASVGKGWYPDHNVSLMDPKEIPESLSVKTTIYAYEPIYYNGKETRTGLWVAEGEKAELRDYWVEKPMIDKITKMNYKGNIFEIWKEMSDEEKQFLIKLLSKKTNTDVHEGTLPLMSLNTCIDLLIEYANEFQIEIFEVEIMGKIKKFRNGTNIPTEVLSLIDKFKNMLKRS